MSEPSRFAAAAGRIRVGLVLIVPWLCLFGPLAGSGEVLAFRDAGNFFYPLFQWQCDEWRAARIPLWNPYDNFGTPAVADATSSTFYPGKLVFLLPLDFASRFNLYIAGHVLLAAGVAYWSGRRCGWDRSAAALGAISYAYGGPVLFQYCNVVFLVGAAWLPLACWLGASMLETLDWRRAIGLGGVLAMMVLGGDPQTAYHVLILLSLYAIQRCWAGWTRARDVGSGPPLLSPAPRFLFGAGEFRSGFALLAAAALVGVGLAAIQVFPSWQWTQSSDRATFDAPRSIWESAWRLVQPLENVDSQAPAVGQLRGLFGSAAPGTHEDKIYYYSVGPWRLGELVWPNVSGRMFPIHRRWLAAFPGERDPWVPSLYLGLMPFVLAVLAWRSCRRGTRERWFRALAVTGLVASFGWYGCGWLIHELGVIAAGHPWAAELGSPVGGMYWLAVVLLPGYAYFRYPAKWLIVAAWGISCMASSTLHAWNCSQNAASVPATKTTMKACSTTDLSSVLRRALCFLGITSLALVVLLFVTRTRWVQWLEHARPHATFGPLDAEGSWRDLLTAVLQTAVVAGLGLLALRATSGSGNGPSCGSTGPAARPNHARLSTVFVLLTAVELTLANHWLIATVPSRQLAEHRASAANEPIDDGRPESITPPRVAHQPARPAPPMQWETTSSPQRLSEVIDWEQRLLLRQHHLLRRINVVDSLATIQSADVTAFTRLAQATRERFGDDFALWRWVGVGRMVADASDGPGRESQPSFAVVPLEPTRPRVWCPMEWQAMAAGRPESRHMLWRRFEEMWLDNGELDNDGWPRVFVETKRKNNGPSNPTFTQPLVKNSAGLIHYSPQRVEIATTMNRDGLVVLSDLWDSGWTASRQATSGGDDTPCEIVRVNGLLRGVILPAGTQRVVFRYQPGSFWLGAICSALSLVIVVTVLFIGRRRD